MDFNGRLVKAVQKLPGVPVLQTVIDDERVSGVSLAIYTYLQSKNDDLVFTSADITKRFDISDDEASKSLDELVNLGYIERFQSEQNEK